MSAIVAELDGMDAATADMFIKLQLLDIHTSAQSTDGALNSAAQWDNMVAMQEYERELKRYRARRGLPNDELPVPEAVEEKPDSAPVAQHHHATVPHGVCLACSDRLPLAELYDCPCPPDPAPHRWCSGCLEHLHRSALTDETLYPPRCCQHVFDFDLVQVYLTPELVQDFEAKKEELDDTNRIYCHVPTCSAYIGADHRQSTLAHCPNDDHDPTCIMCKNAKHDGECEQDMGRRQVEATAAQNGWQTCSACKAVVELNTGCYHITLVGVAAAISSVTSAAQPGKTATVPNGTSVASSTVLPQSMSARVAMQETNRPSPTWLANCATTTAVVVASTAGSGLTRASFVAMDAMTCSRGSFTAVGRAIPRTATGADTIATEPLTEGRSDAFVHFRFTILGRSRWTC
ncbi:hypothetical protein PRZ48_002433 [Zasmidium cellare]|uniref:IBR domain-containing protein n=1 Tax=Zasmidium cellare TaxID=395010 RepID=A0ABR0F5D8_ZASCE|nr:hypothetical protein PRZ48_002433 [Zasmidium cellare]